MRDNDRWKDTDRDALVRAEAAMLESVYSTMDLDEDCPAGWVWNFDENHAPDKLRGAQRAAEREANKATDPEDVAAWRRISDALGREAVRQEEEENEIVRAESRNENPTWERH